MADINTSPATNLLSLIVGIALVVGVLYFGAGLIGSTKQFATWS
ncbi:MAG: hypothetical protein PHQ43_09715 [Dehalococcoidales bacterium]|nr:hypothetical protein [Dehalococcoidales bacterium]